MAASPNFRRAIDNLDKGDIGAAHRCLTGDNRNSVYLDLLEKANATIALTFKQKVDEWLSGEWDFLLDLTGAW